MKKIDFHNALKTYYNNCKKFYFSRNSPTSFKVYFNLYNSRSLYDVLTSFYKDNIENKYIPDQELDQKDVNTIEELLIFNKDSLTFSPVEATTLFEKLIALVSRHNVENKFKSKLDFN